MGPLIVSTLTGPVRFGIEIEPFDTNPGRSPFDWDTEYPRRIGSSAGIF
jgi:hypothetical protein